MGSPLYFRHLLSPFLKIRKIFVLVKVIRIQGISSPIANPASILSVENVDIYGDRTNEIGRVGVNVDHSRQ